jgi:TusA-related sulfurtransferase
MLFGCKDCPISEEQGVLSMETIDLRGVCCPTNFVKAKLALEMADSGDVLEFYLDEGEPVQNVPRSLKAEGNKLLGLEKVDGYYVLTVEKA